MNKLKIEVQQHNGCFSAACECLSVEGWGQTREEAIDGLRFCLLSRLTVLKDMIKAGYPLDYFAEIIEHKPEEEIEKEQAKE